jgi:hypothetical protein
MSNGNILDNLTSAFALLNVAMPGMISLIATFGDGRQVDIKKLLDDTDARVKKTIEKGESFLAKPDPEAETPSPEPPSPPDPPQPPPEPGT